MLMLILRTVQTALCSSREAASGNLCLMQHLTSLVWKFVDFCAEKLGARVEPLSVPSPFEGGRFEKLHDLGGRKMRILLRTHAGRVSGLTDDELDLILSEVCFFEREEAFLLVLR